MLLIVNDSFEASSQNATLAEKASRTETWARLLFNIIPESELQAAFDYAFQTHSSPFPINAYDLKIAHETLERTRYQSFDEVEFKQRLGEQNGGE